MIFGALGLGIGSSAVTALALPSASAVVSGPSGKPDSQFVSAASFMIGGQAPEIRANWPAVPFPKSGATATTTFAADSGASAISIELIWTTEGPGEGNVRWVGGVSWFEDALAIDDDSSGAPWRPAIVPVPGRPKSPVRTRLGEFMVNHTSPCLQLKLTREGDSPDDTFKGDVVLLGIVVNTTVSVPLA
ncbi:hypothetical protein [Antrihabitans cavernicola]|uniref:Uncharacterized protein n=1 Tax=Antrihabitans cavernicola TaxID=2495913 RepID=A0A5A7SFB5_9NOCA|nr:hypothetical protein [Spelaeibacter cavernicola]KAA0023852.1 hypothetical protein FOY51_04475 [Spelaeibacter cavernicola]